MRRNTILLLAALCLAVFLVHGQKDLIVPSAGRLSDFPTQIGNWRLAGQTLFDAPTLKVLRASDYLMRLYTDPLGHSLGVYVGYHDGGPNSGPIHSPRNCLPGSGWSLMSSQELTLNTPAGPVRLMRTLFAKGESRTLYYYWYQVRGECMTGDFELKFSELSGVLMHRRRDSAFIRLDMPDLPASQSDALIGEFLTTAYPELRRFLPGE